MKLSVVFEDNEVVKNGVGYTVELPEKPDIWAVQWSADSGHIEYRDPKKRNSVIDDVAELEDYLSLWELAHTIATQPADDPNHIETVEEIRTRALLLLANHGQSKRRLGYRHNFGTQETPNWQVLQLREPTAQNDDEKNWSAALGAYTAAVVAGHGAVAGVTLRTESNAAMVMSYAQGMGVLTAMFAWVAQVYNTTWGKKDAIIAAATKTEIQSLIDDIPNGW